MTTVRIAGGDVLYPDHSIERGDVLIDRESGEIVAVGNVEGGDITLDASDGILMPGLINAHTHVAMTLFRGFVEDVPLQEWLGDVVWPVEAELTPADVAAGARLGAAEMIRNGITAFQDMYFEVPAIAEVVEAVGLRATVGHTAITVGKDADAAHTDMEASLRVADEFAGAAGGRIDTTVQPHNQTTVGRPYLEAHIPTARERGHPLHYHSNESPEEVDELHEETGLRPIEYADELDMLRPGDTLAHCVHVDDAEIDLLADRGVTVAHCPAAHMKVASGIAPISKMRERGVQVALGTDGPASNNDLDLFDEMCDAALASKVSTKDAAAIPVGDIVDMATKASAEVMGIDAGRVEVGARADLIVVDTSAPKFAPGHDRINDLVYVANGSDVRHTICDGEVLMHDRSLLTVDVEAAKRAATERATALFERAGVS